MSKPANQGKTLRNKRSEENTISNVLNTHSEGTAMVLLRKYAKHMTTSLIVGLLIGMLPTMVMGAESPNGEPEIKQVVENGQVYTDVTYTVDLSEYGGSYTPETDGKSSLNNSAEVAAQPLWLPSNCTHKKFVTGGWDWQYGLCYGKLYAEFNSSFPHKVLISYLPERGKAQAWSSKERHGNIPAVLAVYKPADCKKCIAHFTYRYRN